MAVSPGDMLSALFSALDSDSEIPRLRELLRANPGLVNHEYRLGPHPGLVNNDYHINPPTRSLLYYANEFGNENVVKVLLEFGANPDFVPGDHRQYGGYTLLFASVVEGRVEIVKAYIAAGANVNTQMDMGGGLTSPLSAAIANDDVEIVEALLNAGADTLFNELDGKTIFQHARENKYSPQINKLIIDTGVKQMRNATFSRRKGILTAANYPEAKPRANNGSGAGAGAGAGASRARRSRKTRRNTKRNKRH